MEVSEQRFIGQSTVVSTSEESKMWQREKVNYDAIATGVSGAELDIQAYLEVRPWPGLCAQWGEGSSWVRQIP